MFRVWRATRCTVCHSELSFAKAQRHAVNCIMRSDSVKSTVAPPHDAIDPLDGIRVVSLALNVPGPVASARLHALGATIIKIEPLGGDPLFSICPKWYEELHQGIDVVRLDLKTPAALNRMYELLSAANLFITAFRPASLERMQLGRQRVAGMCPALSQVAIVGESGARAEVAGHDLTYQALAGLLSPPAMPRALLADFSGAERVVSTALQLLFARARGRDAAYAEVSLAHAVEALVAPLSAGLTSLAGPLGGSNPLYRLYETQDGWIALAALERQFSTRLLAELQMDAPDANEFALVFATRTSAAWDAWASARDLPLAAVRLRG
jgi:alpha-methylacyl-CoA racemase